MDGGGSEGKGEKKWVGEVGEMVEMEVRLEKGRLVLWNEYGDR